jgi:hypothetical protein
MKPFKNFILLSRYVKTFQKTSFFFLVTWRPSKKFPSSFLVTWRPSKNFLLLFSLRENLPKNSFFFFFSRYVKTFQKSILFFITSQLIRLVASAAPIQILKIWKGVVTAANPPGFFCLIHYIMLVKSFLLSKSKMLQEKNDKYFSPIPLSDYTT